ncbi:MarR family transcriptional regulator [Kitasatospora sp. NPDC058046]|uniref:MarR family transcriptional regulator n=1 Tax=Kitasatospora sp. NPDC058046 TaxID=3346312 RepID=UPI0036DE90C8
MPNRQGRPCCTPTRPPPRAFITGTARKDTALAASQPLWGYTEVAAHLDIGAARSRKSSGALPTPDDDSIPGRPRWRPSTLQNWTPRGQGYRSDLHTDHTSEPS